MDVDEIRSELADLPRQLLDIADDDVAGKHRLLTRRDELRALAAEHRRDADTERSDTELLSELAARRQQLAAIERKRIDVVKQHGAGSHGTAAGGDGWGAVQLNHVIDQAQDVAGIRARIGRWEGAMRHLGRQSILGLVVIGLMTAACGGGAGNGVENPDRLPNTADPVLTRDPPGSDHVESLAVGLNSAGFDVFGAVAAMSTDDVIVSPLSIGLAFGMAGVGATGETATALEDLFGYPVDGEERWSAFNTLDQSVTDVGQPVVRLANRMFPDESFDTVDGYEETLARFFGTTVEALPLQRASETSRQRINEWVADRTEDLISDLLPEGSIASQTVLLLVNALYLEADWERPFGKYPTEDAPFMRLDGSEVTVPMMHERELSGPAVVTDAYAATEIPYEGGDLSMLVIVPEQGRFEQVQAELSNALVAEIDEAATIGNVELFLPRFESATDVDLRSVFEEDLGVDGLFDVAGGWDGIAPGIFLESAVHAADISVDEHGTVAAAATALGFAESGPPEADVIVRADRPFLYLIRHTSTGAVLFVGRVMDPS